MSNVPAPVSNNLPDIPGYRTYLAAIAGIIATAVLPFLHNMWPWIPSLNVDQTTGVLGCIASLAFLFHRYGMNTVAKYILANIVPVVLPKIEASLTEIVRAELAALQKQSAASGADPVAINEVLNMFGVDPSSDKGKAAVLRLSRKA